MSKRPRAEAPGFRIGTGPSPKGYTSQMRVRDIYHGRGRLASREEVRVLAREWLRLVNEDKEEQDE